jgi:hypothetical protein
MSFGAPSGKISKKQSAKAEKASKLDNNGAILEYTTHGAEVETSEEMYSDVFTNAAINGQQGASVITGHGFDQVNTDYSKETKTTATAGAAVPITTTTTTTGV